MIGSPEQVRRLRWAKARATSLLVVAAIVYLITLRLGDDTWVGYLQAASEAAMVGGIADWFAVTALFRHPLGIPIPHTAVVMRSKDALGSGAGTFIQNTFLNREQLTKRIINAKPSARIATYLKEPAHADALASLAAGFIHSLAETVDSEVAQEQMRSFVLEKGSSTDLGPVLIGLLEHAVDNGHHVPVIDAAIDALRGSIQDAQPVLRDQLRRESPWWVPESVDEAVFERLIEAFDRFLVDVRSQPDHELRKQLDGHLVDQVRTLQSDGTLSASASEVRSDLVNHPTLQAWVESLWDGAIDAIERVATEPTDSLRLTVANQIQTAALRLQEDDDLKVRVDEWMVRLAGSVASNVGAEVATIIETTVEEWDAAETTRWVELGVGGDLQIIRINGTIVGGLVGLLIHFVSHVAG